MRWGLFSADRIHISRYNNIRKELFTADKVHICSSLLREFTWDISRELLPGEKAHMVYKRRGLAWLWENLKNDDWLDKMWNNSHLGNSIFQFTEFLTNGEMALQLCCIIHIQTSNCWTSAIGSISQPMTMVDLIKGRNQVQMVEKSAAVKKQRPGLPCTLLGFT